MKWMIQLLVNGIAVFIAAKVVPGISVKGLGTAILTALILAIINLVVRPLVLLFTLPINIMTLGLFSLVINAFLFWMASLLVSGFQVEGFLPAFLGALIVSLASGLLSGVGKSE